MLAAVRRFASSLFSCGAGPSGAGDLHRAERGVPRRAQPARRKPAEIEAQMESVRRKLEQVEGTIAEEREAARRLSGTLNRELLAALTRRAAFLHARLDALAAELRDEPRPTRGGSLRPCRTAGRSLDEPTGTDKSLAQAARAALRKGRYANASERAVFEKIVSDLSESGSELQAHVLERLGEVVSPAALPIFAAGTRHRSEEVRVAAMRGLLATRLPSSRDILKRALGDASHRVRVWAVRGLYGLDDPDLAELLCVQLRDPHPSVRRTAATYLSWKRIPRAERHLARRLKDGSPDVRVAVIAALGQCGSETSVFELIGALGDESEAVCGAAAAALERLLGATPELSADADEEARRRKVAELRTWWREERVRRLTGEAPEEKPDHLSAGPDLESAKAEPELGDEPAAVESTLDEEPVLEADQEVTEVGEDGLEEEPSLEGGLDDLDGGFISAEGDE